MTRRAARLEGIFSGPSTGANLVVALRLAAQLGPTGRVATIQVDSGLKYLSADLYGDGPATGVLERAVGGPGLPGDRADER